MFQQKLRLLKSFRKLLPNRLLNHAWAGETYQGAWLCDVQVAQHAEAGGHSARGRVGEHGDIRQTRVIQLRQAGGYLGQLHEACDPFHHARAAGRGDDDERLPGSQ